MKLSRRFALDLLFVVGAAFLAIAAMVFSASVAGWIGLGVFTGFVVLAAASAILTKRAGQKIGHSVIGLVALWSLIATGLFTGSALIWLVFAGAIAVGVLALADLAAHESVTENVVHRLEVTTPAQASHRTTV